MIFKSYPHLALRVRPPTLIPKTPAAYVLLSLMERIEVRALHLSFRCSRRIINFSPDQVSSTAHTFTSTNPSGSATARITSSVVSVATPADFFGHETQTVPVAAMFLRKIDNRFSKSRRRLVKRCTNSLLSENFTPAGSLPSNLR